ncbi:winged helix-turn-helix domain-containing protein [Aeromonas sanarellii]|uniref:winged helix-turn-helix domain-containing protein n=1 Tax=Aeromonas sanarellii TaxID=633415 RepID=UPI0039A28D73
MANIYLIDDIEFHVDNHLLKSNVNEEVVLTTPASQCLALLIKEAPEVVSHDRFFQEVWEPKGMLIPHNTLYQNISLIRKAFKQLSKVEKNFIITIPRTGFKLSDNISVTLKVTNTVEESVKFIENTTALVPGTLGKKDNLVSSLLDSKERRPIYVKTAVFLTLMLFILALFLITSYDAHLQRQRDVFQKNITLNLPGPCKFLANPDIIKDESLLTKIVKDNSRCDLFPYVYISAPPGGATVSALSCNSPMGDNAQDLKCVSFIYYGLTSK